MLNTSRRVISLLLLLSTTTFASGWIDAPFSHWLERVVSEPVTEGNDIQLYIDGLEFYPALLDMIRNAQRTIDVSMFLWCDDTAGLTIAQALADASRRGVRVRVIDDWLNFKPHARVFDIIASVALPPLVFNPPNWGLDEVNGRIHEKLVVVDGQAAWISGGNFCNEYMIGGKRKLWHDLAIIARGPVAARVQAHYDKTWDWMAEQEYQSRLGYATIMESPEAGPHVYRTYPLFGPTPQMDNEPAPGTSIAMFEYQQVYMHRDDAKRFITAYSELVKRANHRVIVYAPYFIPEPTFEKALMTTARRGVEVDVITNSQATNDLGGLAVAAQDNHYADILGAGVRIFEVTDTTLHAKAMLIDDEVLSVGSHNLTYRSFHHNGEANILTGDPQAISKFESMVANDMKFRTRQLTLAEEKKKDSIPHRIWKTFASWFGHFF